MLAESFTYYVLATSGIFTFHVICLLLNIPVIFKVPSPKRGAFYIKR